MQALRKSIVNMEAAYRVTARSALRLLRKSKAHLVLTEEHDEHGHLIHRWKRDGIEHIENVSDKLDFIDHGDPVANMEGDEVPAFNKYKDLEEWVGNYWQEKYNCESVNKILGDVKIDTRAAHNSLGHGKTPAKKQAFYLVPDVIARGVVLGELPKETNKPRAFIIGAPVVIGNQRYQMFVLVRRDINMQRMYLHDVILKKNSLSAGDNSTAASPTKEAEPHGTAREAIHILLHSLRNHKFTKSRSGLYLVRSRR